MVKFKQDQAVAEGIPVLSGLRVDYRGRSGWFLGTSFIYYFSLVFQEERLDDRNIPNRSRGGDIYSTTFY